MSKLLFSCCTMFLLVVTCIQASDHYRRSCNEWAISKARVGVSELFATGALSEEFAANCENEQVKDIATEYLNSGYIPKDAWDEGYPCQVCMGWVFGKEFDFLIPLAKSVLSRTGDDYDEFLVNCDKVKEQMLSYFEEVISWE